MATQDLINRLRTTRNADRTLDLALARFIGYRREAVNGEVKWFDPAGQSTKYIPFFTSLIEDARTLAEVLIPGHAGACTFHPPFAAVINDGARCEGATTAIALCIAALTEKNAHS